MQIMGTGKSLEIFTLGIDKVSNGVMILTVQKHTTPRVKRKNENVQ